MKRYSLFISVLISGTLLISACSKENSGDSSTSLVPDHTEKYIGNYFFITVEQSVSKYDTSYYHGTIHKHEKYFGFVEINYSEDNTIVVGVDTAGNFIIYQNGPLSQLWSGNFINENEVNVTYDSLPSYFQGIYGVRE